MNNDHAKLLDLNDLRIFAFVATLKSFSDAAEKLNIHKSSVSRCIARLEEDLHVALLERTTRKVKLTRAGLALRDRCNEMLNVVSETIGYVGSIDSGLRGPLNVCIDSRISLGIVITQELIPKFIENNPEVALSLRFSERKPDLTSSRVDVAVTATAGAITRASAARESGLIENCLCAAPEYLRSRPPLDSVEAMSNHVAVIHDEIELADDALIHETQDIGVFGDARHRLWTNSITVLHEMLLGGVGIGCLPMNVCAADLRSGRLVRVLEARQIPPLRLTVGYPSKKHHSPLVRAFVDLLLQGGLLQPKAEYRGRAVNIEAEISE